MVGYDAVVVGGGIVGASAAYHLARAGARTLLIDRSDVGRATDAGAGILSTASNTHDPDPVHRFAALAATYYPALITRLKDEGAQDTGYGVCGSLIVAVSDEEAQDFAHLRPRLRYWQNDGCAEVSPEDARRLFPPLAPVRGAIHCNHAARVDGRLLALALRQAGEKRGLVVREAAVERIAAKDGRTEGVVVAGETIAAGNVVLAAGAWSARLAEPLGLRVPVKPQRGQIVHLGLDADTSRWPMVSALRGEYIVPWPDGRVAVGATRESGAGFAPCTTVAGVMEVLAEALRVAPGLAQASVREIRVGLRPLCRDGLPIIGPAPDVAGLYLATGHGAIGLQLGPYSGKVVADLITRGSSEADLARFLPTRFLSAAGGSGSVA